MFYYFFSRKCQRISSICLVTANMWTELYTAQRGKNESNTIREAYTITHAEIGAKKELKWKTHNI